MDGWPVVNPKRGGLEPEFPSPDLPPHPWPEHPARDDFDTDTLAFCWNFLRNPREQFWNLMDRPGHLRLRLRPEQLSEWVNPSFVGRRQQHINFVAETLMEFVPENEHECAGVVVYQNSDHHFRFVVSLINDTRMISLIKREKDTETKLAEVPLSYDHFHLKVSAQGQAYSFFASEDGKQWHTVAENVDGRMLSTTVAGGFVGTYIGLYASSNGVTSQNTADFDWFDYKGI
jgi:alpha-N-arabinofuranosidase